MFHHFPIDQILFIFFQTELTLEKDDLDRVGLVRTYVY